MRILHLGKHYWPSYGGIETALRDLAETGAAAGHAVGCVVAADRDSHVARQTIGGVLVHRLRSYGKLLSAPLAPGYLSLSFAEADVVHLHLPNPLAELKVYATLRRDPHFADRLAPFLHAVPVRQGWLGRLWFRLVTRPILARAKRILVSNWSFFSAYPELERWRAKTTVLSFVAPESPAFSASASLADSDQAADRYVLALGRLVSYKGYDLVLRAYALLAAQRARLLPLWIAGEGPERERLETLAQELGIADRVRFLGAFTDAEKSRLFANAAFLVAPSLSAAETFGIAILEAMAAGRAVVVTDLATGVRELARGGECGAVVPVGDVSALATAIAVLTDDKSRRDRAGQENREFVRARYGRAALEKAYSECLAGFKSRAE